MRITLERLALLTATVACSPVLHVGEPNDEGSTDAPGTVLSSASQTEILELASTRPVPVVTESDAILTFGVDGEDLYWIVLDDRPTEPPGNVAWHMNRCSLDDCAGTMQRLGGSTMGEYCISSDTRPIAFDRDAAYFAAAGSTGCGMIRCDKDGWQGAVERIAESFPSLGMLVGNTMYAWNDTTVVWRCQVPECAQSVAKDSVTQPIDGEKTDYAGPLWDADAEYLYGSWHARILRIRRDTPSPFEVLARDEPALGGLVVQGDAMYWTESVTLGAVKTCPTTGCVDEPEIVLDGLDAPRQLTIDQNYLYVVEPMRFTWTTIAESIPGTGRLVRHALDGSEPQRVLAEGRDGLGKVLFSATLGLFLSCEDRTKIEPTQNLTMPPAACQILAIPRR